MKLVVTLILLSVGVAGGTIAALYSLSQDELSAYSTAVAAAGSLLAVIWFTGSLWNQMEQLRTQQRQFLEEIRHLKRSATRDALMASKQILDACEQKAKDMAGTASVGEICSLLGDVTCGAIFLNSSNPQAVLDAVKTWKKREAAALEIVRGIKSAAELYFESQAINDIDFSKDPARFVEDYGSRLWTLPFFGSLRGHAATIAMTLNRLQPLRKAADLAFYGATASGLGAHYVLLDKVKEEAECYRENGHRVPVILELVLSNDE